MAGVGPLLLVINFIYTNQMIQKKWQQGVIIFLSLVVFLSPFLGVSRGFKSGLISLSGLVILLVSAVLFQEKK